MSIEDLVSTNFEKQISFSFDPLKGTLQHIIKVLEQHNSMFQRLQDNSSIFESTEQDPYILNYCLNSSEEEEKKKVQQSKHERQMLEPIFKRIGQLEKMITESNKELSQLQRQKFSMGSNRGSPVFNNNGRRTILSPPRLHQLSSDNFSSLIHPRDTDDLLGGSMGGDRGFGITLEKIAEEKLSEGGSSPSMFNEVKINHILLQLKREFIDTFGQRMDSMEHKFDAEIAKINTTIENELGIDHENEIMQEESSDDDRSSTSSKMTTFKQKQLTHKHKTSRDSVIKYGNNNNNNNTIEENIPTTESLMVELNVEKVGTHQSSTAVLQNPNNQKGNEQQLDQEDVRDQKRKNVKKLERMTANQRTLNDISLKQEFLLKSVAKLNDYFDKNNLKKISILDLQTQVSTLEKALEQKATSLDLKKLTSRMNEVQDLTSRLEEKSQQLDKGLSQLEISFNNTQKQNNYKLQYADQKLDALNKELQELKRDVDIKFGSKNLLSFAQQNEGIPPDVLQDKIKQQLLTATQQHQKEFESLRNLIIANEKKCEGLINTKIDKEELEETHEKFSVLLEKFMNNANKKFMDKVDTKKTFKILEKQLKNLFEIVISKFEEQDTTDAMMAKKPLGGWSCASCQKNITNLASAIAEYQVSGKFPWRDPHDRLHHVGAGYSKMLQSMRPETQADTHNNSRLQQSMSSQQLRGNLQTASVLNPSTKDSNLILPPPSKLRGTNRDMARTNIQLQTGDDLLLSEDSTPGGGHGLSENGAKFTPIQPLTGSRNLSLFSPKQVTTKATHKTKSSVLSDLAQQEETSSSIKSRNITGALKSKTTSTQQKQL